MRFEQDVPCPILILHALNDATIPYSHSATLFNHLLHHQSCLSNHTTTSSQVIFSSSPLVKISPAGSWGSIRTLSRLGMIEEGKSTGDVIWAEAEKGGHNDIGAHEYSMKLISKVMRTD
jgi:abhydrolase domain-containing protein 12